MTLTDYFMKWSYLIQEKDDFYKKNNKIVIRRIAKSYPCKSKKKRIIKKWWKKHSEVIEFDDVKLEKIELK